ncbi:glycosyltransferase [Flavobacterium sp. LT1R49]|uniref:glycosyltransferase n=1 Tax=Flavobacterium arabinosi TaxID=3398737 RepID=UPI003A85FC08
MKVVHVVEAMAGGVHTYFKDLSFFFGNHEINENINTTIIYSGNRKEINSKRIKKDFSKGVSLIELNMVRSFSPLKDLKSLVRLTRELEKLNPDVIHLHSSKAGVLGRIACFLLFKKIKLFYTPHGYSFLRTDISYFNKKIYTLIENGFQIIFGGLTIACGDTEYEIAKKIGKSYLIRNGIDIKDINENVSGNKNKILTIGIVGRITAARNPKLFNEIALKHPNHNFVWIGDGELKQQITAPNIRITGWFLKRKHALKELNTIDIYIQTSLWEGLPIAVLEAMAMQKPVLATNIIGNKDVVVHNETGFLFDDVNELEKYIEILKDEKIRDNFGKKGLERCQNLFDSAKNFTELVSLYKQ